MLEVLTSVWYGRLENRCQLGYRPRPLTVVKMYQIEAQEIQRCKGLAECLSLAVALSTIPMTVRFGSFHPSFNGEHPEGGQGPSTYLPLSTNHM
ncbi:hypothetical protein TNCV_4873961 [Trichonephila clavipes]|nr:hypothetical protein TNCV_4873961 [Trichonephila clavipes]